MHMCSIKKSLKKIVEWFATSKILSFPRKIFLRIFLYGLRCADSTIVSYNAKEQKKVFSLIRKIRPEICISLTDQEAYQLYRAVEASAKIRGVIAEVGVYYGGSARIICEVKGSKPLHLFDTFEGLPGVEEIDSTFIKGEYSWPLEGVKKNLSRYKEVYFHKGIFPQETGKEVESLKFSMVNIDVDTYRSTFDCLGFFIPE